jgi:EAL domain-containing protein (putative c-di-GMP-specific phosphodiesterase class I)
LLKFADIAMYRAKNSGRNQVAFYQPEMIRQIQYRRSIQTELRKALKEEQLELNYQPIYNCQSHEVVAIEAMLCVEKSQKLNALEQAELFSIADESQVAVQLSEWMLDQALNFLNFQANSDVQVAMVVPVRPAHFHQKQFVDWLSERIESLEFPPQNLVLSLNENCLNAQRFPVEKQLKLLSKLGVEIAVQNFGSGNLSPLRLHDWAIDWLFLSSLFVTEITNKRSMESMAMALIQMGQTLNKKVVAYGVRSAEQQAFLLSQHCNLMQGPYLNEPMAAADMELLLLNGVVDNDESHTFLEEYDEY